MFRVYLCLLILVSCYSAGSYGWFSNKEACSGEDLTIALAELNIYGRYGLYFTPAKGDGEKIHVMLANGTLLDPHYEISSDQLIIREVTERDEGDFSYNMVGVLFKSMTLKIKDCSSKVTKDYGSDYYFRVSKTAYSLEFTNTYSTAVKVLLWNRTRNSYVGDGGGRGRLVNNKWQMEKLTQEYNGYYTFRDKNHKFISRTKMTVEEQKPYALNEVEGQDLEIINFRPRMDPDRFDLTFNPTNDPEPLLLMKAGKLLTNYHEWEMEGRMFANRIDKFDGPSLQITIQHIQPSDSGYFKLIDQKGNLALIQQLNVEKLDPPYPMYVGFAVGILAVVVICCCCVKKCCCRKTTRKNDFVPQTEAAPAVYNYENTTQPSTSAHPSSSYGYGPTYSAPLCPKEPGSTYHQPLDTTQPSTSAHPSSSCGYGPYGPTYSAPLCPKEPGSTYHQPLVPGPENHHVSSSHFQPEVSSTAFLGVDTLSSDAGPQFELKGMAFASAPPLSSHTSYSDVYTSDKLNFL